MDSKVKAKEQERFPRLSRVPQDTEIVNHPGLPWHCGDQIVLPPFSPATLVTATWWNHLLGGRLSLSPLTTLGSRAGSPVGTVSLPASGTNSGGGGSKGSAGVTSAGSVHIPVVASEAGGDSTGTNLLSTGNLGLIGDLLVLLGLGVAVEVQVNDGVPLGLTGSQGATETQDLTGKQPPDQTDGVTALVVGGDGNVNEVGGGVSVAESDDGDVDVAGLLDSLSIGARVGHDNETGLLERAGDVVGEVTGGETTGNGGGTGVGGELQDSTLTVGTSGDDTDVGGVVDGGDDAGSQDNLLPIESRDKLDNCKFTRVVMRISCIPGLANVDDIDTVGASLPEVGLHVHLKVLGTQVALSSQEHLNVLGGRVENRGELGGGHGGRLKD